MKKIAMVLGVAYAFSFSLAAGAQQGPGDGPRFANGNDLVRPADYREWIYLSSGLGMTYQPPAGRTAAPTFGNVFVNPSSYRSFMQTGKWPNGTTFVLEFRNSDSEASINKDGRFQTSLVGMEAEVKDARFPDGWAYFGFQQGAASTAPLAGNAVAACIDCHTRNTAVERTFVQF